MFQMNLLTSKFNVKTCLVEITMLSMLFNSLHKGNFILCGNSGIQRRWELRQCLLIELINSYFLEQASHQWYIGSYGFIYDGRRSYTKVSVNCFVKLLYVLTMLLLFSLNITLMEWKVQSCSNFHIKGIFKHSCKVGVELHRECFDIFSMENCKPVIYL